METKHLTERLQKILAHAGYGSRRGCETMIEEGRVTVDGKISKLGDKADPQTQRITLDGMPIRKAQAHTYIMLHKPRGIISTTSDPEDRRTVRDLVNVPQRLYPVGRLDIKSEGLILLTDDGDLTQHLTHPRYEHPRVYRTLVDGEPGEADLRRWLRGINLDGEPVKFDAVEIISVSQGRTWLLVTVHEGRKHLVRRVINAMGYFVVRLIRVKMGPLQLDTLRPGRWRYLNRTEISALRKKVGLSDVPGGRPNPDKLRSKRNPNRRGSNSRSRKSRR